MPALLMAADGVANEHIAAEVGASPTTVQTWRKRFAEVGLAKLDEVRRRYRRSLQRTPHPRGIHTGVPG